MRYEIGTHDKREGSVVQRWKCVKAAREISQRGIVTSINCTLIWRSSNEMGVMQEVVAYTVHSIWASLSSVYILIWMCTHTATYTHTHTPTPTHTERESMRKKEEEGVGNERREREGDRVWRRG